MFESATSIPRREFLQGATLAVAGGLLADLASIPVAFGQVCAPAIPVQSSAPSAYLKHPGLLALRADTLLQQLKNGYGYYGQPRNWVTLWSRVQISNAIDQILKNDQIVADSITALTCATDALIANARTYDDAIAAAQQVQSRIMNTIDENRNKATALLKFVSDLATDIAAQKQIVDNAEAQFDQAVMMAASGGCGLTQVLAVVAAVIAVASAVYTAGTSVVAAYSAIGSLATTGIKAASDASSALANLKAAYDQLKPIVSKVETAINDANDIKAKYDKLQLALSADADSARVVVEQASFDKLSADRLDTFDKSINGATNVPQDTRDALEAVS